MRKLSRILCLLLALVMLLGVFGACNTDDKPNDNGNVGENPPENNTHESETVQLVYAQAQKLGYEGSLDEFLALCKGKDGIGISGLKIDENGNLIAYYTNAPTTPVDLGKVVGATGPQGPQGAQGPAGTAPQIRINTTTYEWEISTDNGVTWVTTGVKAVATNPCANGHTPGEWIVQERGDDLSQICADLIKYKLCTVCGNIAEVGIDQGAGHLEIEDELIEEGSCTTPAKWRIFCEICNETLWIEVDDSFRHTPGSWTMVQRPTAQSSAVWEQRCTICGELMGTADRNPVTGVVDDRYDQNGRLKDDLPNDLNYYGEIINLMYWKEVENPEFEQEEITGDNVRDAIYERNVNVEDRLNVDLNFIPVYAAYHGAREPFLKHIDAIYLADTRDYDIIATYSRTEGTLAVQGFLQNFSKIKDSYIDLEKPWWPASLVENVSFGNGDYYFISGDMSTNVLHMMHSMYINKTMFEEYEIELPYQTVRDGKWTVDQLIALTSGKYEDLDGDNSVSTGNMYGFCALNYVCDSFYPAANLRYLEANAQDTLILSPDYTSLRATRLIAKLGAWAATDSVWITGGASTEEESNMTRKLFKQKQALVWMEHASTAARALVDVDFSYGIVPNPKYDEKQINYYTGVGNPISLYGIYVGFDDRGDRDATLQMFSAVLECYASEAYRLTTPEIFEVNMQLKYSEGQDETDMFEYVRSGIVFDLGKIFSIELDQMTELPSNAIASGAQDWQYMVPAYKRSIEAKLKAIVQDFRSYQQQRQ